MTAVAVVPSSSARARIAVHTSSGMRTVRAGVLGWLGTTTGAIDLHGCEPRFGVENGGFTRLSLSGPCATCVDRDSGLLVSGCLGDYAVNVDSLLHVGDACGGGDGGDGVCVHGSTLPGVIHPCKRETEKLQ